MKKMIKNIFLKLFFLYETNGAFAQGAFTNLNFESAVIIPDTSSPFYPHDVNVTNALPGWTVTGNFDAPDVIYNSESLGSAAVSVQGPGSGFPTIQGNYFVLLQSGNGHVTISQTGLIPSTAQSLTFWGEVGPGDLLINGQIVPFGTLGTTANYDIYGANIAAFAGQTCQLLFTAQPNVGAEIDNIQFSSSAVPEPATWSLMICGVAALVFWRRK